MSKKLHITAELLREHGACDEDQIDLFESLHPDGVKVYRSGKALQALADDLARQGFNVGWVARKFNLTVAVTCYYTNGQASESAYLVNGKPHGECVGYYPDGQVSYRFTYVKGKKHGECVSYYPDGSVDYAFTYKHGVVA